MHMYDDFAFTESDTTVQRTEFDPKDLGVPERATDATEVLCGMELSQFAQEDQEIISITQNGEITISSPDGTTIQNGPSFKDGTTEQPKSQVPKASDEGQVRTKGGRGTKTPPPHGKPPIAVTKRAKPRPQAAQRSSSLSGPERTSSSSKSPSPTEVQLRDAGTQFSIESCPSDPLLVAGRVLQSKVKTAHVRQLSPGGHLPRSKSHTPPASPGRGNSSRLPTAVRKGGVRTSPRHSVPGAVISRRGRSVLPGLMSKVKDKLKEEMIQLADHPYSLKVGT